MVSLFNFFDLFLGLCFLIVAMTLMGYYSKRLRPYFYRKLMTDMYVVGKIKQLADKDKVKLDAELEEYLKITKRLHSRPGTGDVDDAIEAAIIKQIREDQEKEMAVKK